MTDLTAPPRRRGRGHAQRFESEPAPVPAPTAQLRERPDGLVRLQLRIRRVAGALREGDEPEIRDALRQLATEASVLAASDPLPVSPQHRQRSPRERPL